MTSPKSQLSHDELVSRIKSKGWAFVADDNGTQNTGHTLEDAVRLSHARRQSGKPPGLIKDIENAVELDLIQLEKLWQYLGLPN